VSTRILLLVCAVAAFSSPSLAASSSDFDGKYSGPIMCDALPVAAPLHTTFFLEITNGLAAYHKDVLQANTGLPSGVTERGTGTVSPDGDVSLKGSAGAPGWSFEAAYQGKFSGKNLHLSGAQKWSLPASSGGAQTRPCTISLSPSK